MSGLTKKCTRVSFSTPFAERTMAAVKPVGKLYVTVESASVTDKESEQWTKALSASLKGAAPARRDAGRRYASTRQRGTSRATRDRRQST